MAVADGGGVAGGRPPRESGKGPKSSGNPFTDMFADYSAPGPGKAREQKKDGPSPYAPEKGSLTKLTPFLEVTPAHTVTTPAAEEVWTDYHSDTGYPRAWDMPADQQLMPAPDQEVEVGARVKTRKRRSYEMTWEQYNALSPQQKAAVDFNTELVKAREKDLNSDYDPRPKQEQRYEKSVEELFGKDGASTEYAPEVVGLLNKIDFKAVKDGLGSDLDDFLGLKTAISMKDLETLGLGAEAPPSIESYTSGAIDNRLEVKSDLASNTSALQESMVKAGTMLQDFTTTMDKGLNPFLKFYGGDPNKVQMDLGYGDELVDQTFRKWAEMFARDDIDPSVTWADIERTNIPEEDRKALIRYLDTFTSRADEYHMKLGQNPEHKYRKPEVVRKFVGLDDSGARDGTP